MSADRPVLIATVMREEGATGVQTHMAHIARHLRHMGRRVEMVAPYGRDALWLYPWFALRFPLERLHRGLSIWWYRQTRWVALWWRLRLRLRDGRPAIVYAQCPVSASAALAARRNAAQVVVMVVHYNVSQADEFVGQMQIRPQGWVWRQIRSFEARVLPQLDAILYVSPFAQAQSEALIPAVASLCHEVIPNFVEDPGPVPARSAHRIRRLVSIGTLEPRKNQSYLLEVFAKAHKLQPSLQLTLIGDGLDRARLEAQARTLGLGPALSFWGVVPGAAQSLAEFDALIHTPTVEAFGIVLIEAMARGLPVFATPVGGIPQVFEDGWEGVYLPLHDAEAAGRLLAERADDAEICARMSLAARQRFKQDYDAQTVAARLTRFLDGVTPRRSPAGGVLAPERSVGGVARAWAMRLWHSTSLPAQVLHSATSFIMMAGMARFAPSGDFALAAAYFLLVTLASSLGIHVLNAAWLRTAESSSSAGMHHLKPFTLLSSVGLAAALSLFWAGYRFTAFGPGTAGELLLAALGSLAYLYYLAMRRQWLLSADLGKVALGDSLRALVMFGGAGLLHEAGRGWSFPSFLILFLAAHAAAVMPAWQSTSTAAATGSWWARSLRPLSAVKRGDWLGVGSGLANVVFSQAASLIAPLLVGPTEYATLRAYELFLFPAIFMAQVLDPIYMRRYRHSAERALPDRGRELLLPAALMFLPLALACLAAMTLPIAHTALEALIAPAYRPAFWLLGLVLGVSAWIALNAPLRWRLTVAGQGGALLKGTLIGIVLSLGLLAVLTPLHPEAWTVLLARMVYEASLLMVGLNAFRGLHERVN